MLRFNLVRWGTVPKCTRFIAGGAGSPCGGARQENLGYSGYTIDDILEDKLRSALLHEIDILVDGRFVDELKDPALRFRGSSNQRIIDVKKTLETGEVVLAME